MAMGWVALGWFLGIFPYCSSNREMLTMVIFPTLILFFYIDLGRNFPQGTCEIV